MSVDFDPKEWAPGQVLPAGDLNRIERGIERAHDKIDGGAAQAAAEEAARVAVAASSIIGSARVQGGRLLFTRNDGTELDAGSVAGVPGEPGAPGADGSGTVTYADNAAMDAVLDTEIGVTPYADLGAFFSHYLLDGISGRALVTTTRSTTSAGMQMLIQQAEITHPGDWVISRWMRVKPQYVAGVWEPWTGWYNGEQYAGESYYGLVRLATTAMAQSFSASSEDVVQVKNLPQIAVSAATGNRIIRRDGNGRAKVATPSAADDIATKGYADTGAWASVPASATAAGTAGAKARDASWLYVCVATNTWRRVALSAW